MRGINKRWPGWLGLGLAITLGLPDNARAHLVTTGLGPFYDGMLHLLLSPEDLLATAALALLAGLRGPKSGRMVLLFLPLAWLIGGLGGIYWPVDIQIPLVATALFFGAGLLVALDLKLPVGAVAALAVFYGAFFGFLNGTALGLAQAGPLGVAGNAVIIFALVALISGLVVSLKPAWTRIVIRVAGSWVAAVGLLVFGWLVRGTG